MRQKLWRLVRLEERGTASKGSTTRAGPENSARLGVEVGGGNSTPRRENTQRAQRSEAGRRSGYFCNRLDSNLSVTQQ